MKSRKQRVNKRGFYKTHKNKRGGVGSLKLSSADKTKIGQNIAKLEEINTLNKTAQSQQISVLLDEIKEIINVNTLKNTPIYDIPRPRSADFASSESEPMYDLGDAAEIREDPTYDLGDADKSPIYDLVNADELSTSAQQKRTFNSLIAEILNSHNIKTKDDLDHYCEGSGRNKLYLEVKDKCLQNFPSVKCNHKDFKAMIRAIYEKKLIGYKLYKPRNGRKSIKA